MKLVYTGSTPITLMDPAVELYPGDTFLVSDDKAASLLGRSDMEEAVQEPLVAPEPEPTPAPKATKKTETAAS